MRGEAGVPGSAEFTERFIERALGGVDDSIGCVEILHLAMVGADEAGLELAVAKEAQLCEREVLDDRYLGGVCG